METFGIIERLFAGNIRTAKMKRGGKPPRPATALVTRGARHAPPLSIIR
jgi:hypothetical protein